MDSRWWYIYLNWYMANKYHVLKVHQIKNQNMQKKRYLFATYGFCHKPHILLHNSFLLSYYFWKSINKWLNGADLKLSNKKSKYAKKRYLFATYGFCHKPHILLHNSFLLSYYFWKSINKWRNGGELKLALWAMGKTEKGA